VGKRAVLVLEVGRPEYIAALIRPELRTPLHGKDMLQERAAVRGHRDRAARHPDRVHDHRAVAAAAHALDATHAPLLSSDGEQRLSRRTSAREEDVQLSKFDSAQRRVRGLA
jgi:hypothetical protein